MSGTVLDFGGSNSDPNGQCPLPSGNMHFCDMYFLLSQADRQCFKYLTKNGIVGRWAEDEEEGRANHGAWHIVELPDEVFQLVWRNIHLCIWPSLLHEN